MNYVETAIARIQEFCPPEGYWLAFSGGKDSQAIYHLAEMAGVKFDAHYAVTTIDPPPLVRFIRKNYPSVVFEHPEVPFLRKLETKGFPLRQRRWCCELYKEHGGDDRVLLLGLRWEESAARAKRKMVQHCTMAGKGSKLYVSPIIDWTKEQVWGFLGDRPHCELYDQGWERIGCLMCPFAPDRKRMIEARTFPRYTEAYIKAFEKLHATGRDSMKRWANGRDMFWWWLGAPDEEKQQELFT
jgi:phosphoadenosine phosphosulfate reductase